MTELRPFRNIRTSRVTGNVTPGPGRDQLRPGWGEGEPGVAGTRDTGSGRAGTTLANTNTRP